MKRGLIAALVLAALAALVMALAGGREDGAGRNAGAGQKIAIVASLFPQYDFARAIAGDKAAVTLLLPPGVESHTFDPKPADMTKIHNADLFIYTGEYMEPWAARVIAGASDGGARDLLVVDASGGIVLAEDGHGHDDGHEREHEGVQDHEHDPHIWLDPTLAMKMVDNIADALCEKDPANAEFYRDNAANYREELTKLDDDIFAAVRAGKRDTLVFGGRFAYLYFLKHFGLRYVTAFDSCSTEAEPSVRDVARVIDYVRERGIPCIYHEEFVDPKVARSIAEQTGASLELFATAHNVTKDELERGVTFIGVMRGNLARIEKGLN